DDGFAARVVSAASRVGRRRVVLVETESATDVRAALPEVPDPPASRPEAAQPVRTWRIPERQPVHGVGGRFDAGHPLCSVARGPGKALGSVGPGIVTCLLDAGGRLRLGRRAASDREGIGGPDAAAIAVGLALRGSQLALRRTLRERLPELAGGLG